MISKQKKVLKIKISLHRLYIYYKQLLHIFHIMHTIDNVAYLIVNNQMLLSRFLETHDLFVTESLHLNYFKFNIRVYKFLKKNKLFNLYKLNNLFFFKNFNFILQIPVNFKITIKFLHQFIILNASNLQFIYVKIPFYVKILSLDYYKEFLEKQAAKDVVFLKQLKLPICAHILFLRLLNLNLHITNVTNNFPIN